MRTKICGITNYEDAIHAINAGANALGFVFYEQSPRYITPADATAIIKMLPPFVEKVALFVNATAEEINTICSQTGATLAQLHFEVDASIVDELTVPYLRVIRAQKPEDVFHFAEEYRLIDAFCESYGGAGKRLALEWFEGIDCSKIILAGGLDASSVTALKSYGFYGVDVSSGVEISYGKKDPKKVSEFIHNAQ